MRLDPKGFETLHLNDKATPPDIQNGDGFLLLVLLTFMSHDFYEYCIICRINLGFTIDWYNKEEKCGHLRVWLENFHDRITAKWLKSHSSHSIRKKKVIDIARPFRDLKTMLQISAKICQALFVP